MEFFVHVDRTGTEAPAVHKATCRCVRARKPGAVTARWYGPFALRPARRVADKEAGRWRVRDHPRCCGGTPS